MVLRAGTYVTGMPPSSPVHDPVLGHGDIVGQRRSTKRRQVHRQHDVAFTTPTAAATRRAASSSTRWRWLIVDRKRQDAVARLTGDERRRSSNRARRIRARRPVDRLLELSVMIRAALRGAIAQKERAADEAAPRTERSAPIGRKACRANFTRPLCPDGIKKPLAPSSRRHRELARAKSAIDLNYAVLASHLGAFPGRKFLQHARDIVWRAPAPLGQRGRRVRAHFAPPR